uniref:Uncharacterized protein n=2 Tax=Picea TaxID=3328 RepID=A0A101M5D8_PICGL|nr:hypothetical protein ABT39_MTgene1035 [Picea glauca]QHR90043.1 hypothetical protein Q903MT_gene4066 [Picea sitchensis]
MTGRTKKSSEFNQSAFRSYQLTYLFSFPRSNVNPPVIMTYFSIRSTYHSSLTLPIRRPIYSFAPSLVHLDVQLVQSSPPHTSIYYSILAPSIGCSKVAHRKV